MNSYAEQSHSPVSKATPHAYEEKATSTDISFTDNRPLSSTVAQLQKIMFSAPSPSGTEIIQKAADYPFGAGNVTPHIHRYSGGDCHVKVAGGSRYDLVQRGSKVKQSKINEAFDRVRADYPDAANVTRVALLAKMREMLRGAGKHTDDK